MSAMTPVALITGGAKGIGRAIARHLGSSGWQISIIDLPGSGLHRVFARERNVLVIQGDVRDEETVSDTVAATVRRYGRLESYSASKGGLLALTHALAVSLAPDVRVNCVSPGWIKTKDYAGLRRKDHRQHPAGRVGKPDDVAELVGWLLNGKRSGFVTGANFVIDGGMTRKMIYED